MEVPENKLRPPLTPKRRIPASQRINIDQGEGDFVPRKGVTGDPSAGRQVALVQCSVGFNQRKDLERIALVHNGLDHQAVDRRDAAIQVKSASYQHQAVGIGCRQFISCDNIGKTGRGRI